MSSEPGIVSSRTGSFKISEQTLTNDGRYHQFRKFKSCKVTLINIGGKCFLRVQTLICEDQFKDIPLQPGVLAQGKSDTIFVKMKCGRNIQMKDIKRGCEFADAINNNVNNKINKNAVTMTPLVKSNRAPATSTPRQSSQQSPLRDRNLNSARKDLDTSPLFTHVKRRNSESSEYKKNSDILFGDENTESHVCFARNPDKKPALDFLKNASEKSKSLENLNTSSFYSKQPYSRQYGAFSNKSYSTGAPKTYSQRIPRLLHAFPENAQKKLQNLDNSHKYTWTTPKSSPLVTKDQAKELRGFSNLGNTCYMNAILQALFGLVSFGKDLRHLVLQSRKFSVAEYQKTLYFVLDRLNNAAKSKVDKEKTKQYLEEVKRSISTSAKRFSGNEQHDAHEFLSQVIDQVKEDVLKVNKSIAKQKEGQELEEEKVKDDVSVDSDSDHNIMKDPVLNPSTLNFELQILHTITCLGCKQEVKKIEHFNALSIDMPKRKNADEESTLQNALDQFFHSEEIEYTCEECQHNRVQVEHKFYKAPRVIILHLKRYHFNSATIVNKKLGRNIKIAKYLTLWGHADESTSIAFPDNTRDFYDQHCGLTVDDNFMNTSNIDSSSPKSHSFSFKKTDNKFYSPLRKTPLKDKDIATNTDDFETLSDKRSGIRNKELDRVLEISRKESEVKKKIDNKYVALTNGMSEEDQMKLALEQSMQDSKLDCSDSIRNTSQENINIAVEQSLTESKNNVPSAVTYNNMWPDNIPVDDIDFEEETYEQEEKRPVDTVDLTTDNKNPQQHPASDIFISEGENRSNNNNVDSVPSVPRSDEPHEVSMETSATEPTPKKLKLTPPTDTETDQASDAFHNGTSATDSVDMKITTPEKDKPHVSSHRTPKSLDSIFNSVADDCNKADDPFVAGRKKRKAPDNKEFAGLSSDSDNDVTELITRRQEDVRKGDTAHPDQYNPMEIEGAKGEPHIKSDLNDWSSTIKTKDDEEKEINRAIEMSLLDQNTTAQGISLISDSPDEDLKRAIELSLKDWSEANGMDWQDGPEEESFLAELPKIALGDLKRREENQETGEMPFSYRLVSVVSHLGSSAAGHYISDVYNIEKECWYSYDDSEVSRLSEDCVRQNRERSGYIFFYFSKEVLDELKEKEKCSPVSKENNPGATKSDFASSLLKDGKPALQNRDMNAQNQPIVIR